MASEVFRGASTHTLDDKARLIVPKRFMDRLPKVDNNFVLTASQDKCLLLLSKGAFDAKASDFEIDPLGVDSGHRAKLRRFLGHAEDVKPDRAGRIVISEALRAYMGLGSGDKQQVVVVGMGGMIELWAADQWRAQITDSASDPGSLEDSSVESDAADA